MDAPEAAGAATVFHDECAICLTHPTGRAWLLQCGHVFHAACFHNWQRQLRDGLTICPLCRGPVDYCRLCDVWGKLVDEDDENRGYTLLPLALRPWFEPSKTGCLVMQLRINRDTEVGVRYNTHDVQRIYSWAPARTMRSSLDSFCIDFGTLSVTWESLGGADGGSLPHNTVLLKLDDDVLVDESRVSAGSSLSVAMGKAVFVCPM